MTIVTPSPTSVYRYYDRNGLLLYVGITSRGIKRNREHNDTKEWWPYVHRQSVTHFPTREDALAREKSLIVKFHPPFNTQHNPDHDEMRALYLLQAALPGSGLRRKPTDAEKGMSRKARRLLTVIDHRLPLTKVQFSDFEVVYTNTVRHSPLAVELTWRPGVILRANAKKAGVLVGIRPAERTRHFVFRWESGNPAPQSVVMKLRIEQHPMRAYIYEAVAS